MKAVNAARPMMKSGLRPKVSDNGATTKGPTEYPKRYIDSGSASCGEGPKDETQPASTGEKKSDL
jgi:hypothetical protein